MMALGNLVRYHLDLAVFTTRVSDFGFITAGLL